MHNPCRSGAIFVLAIATASVVIGAAVTTDANGARVRGVAADASVTSPRAPDSAVVRSAINRGAYQSASSPFRAVWCLPSVTARLPSWQGQVFKISFCFTYFLLTNTETGRSWTEGFGGWFCRNASPWLVRLVTFGRYSRC